MVSVQKDSVQSHVKKRSLHNLWHVKFPYRHSILYNCTQIIVELNAHLHACMPLLNSQARWTSAKFKFSHACDSGNITETYSTTTTAGAWYTIRTWFTLFSFHNCNIYDWKQRDEGSGRQINLMRMHIIEHYSCAWYVITHVMLPNNDHSLHVRTRQYMPYNYEESREDLLSVRQVCTCHL